MCKRVELRALRVKLVELYECTSKSGAIRRIRNMRRRLSALAWCVEVDELSDLLDKESEFWNGC